MAVNFDALDDGLDDILPKTRGPKAATESGAQAGFPSSSLPESIAVPSTAIPDAPDPSGFLPDEAYQDDANREPANFNWHADADRIIIEEQNDWPEPVDLWGSGGGQQLPDFNPAWLPPAIAPYVIDQADRAGVDPAQVALNCYVICAALIRAGIGVQMQEDMGDGGRVWTEYPILWGAVIGMHGEKKGVGLDIATHHFRAIDARIRMQEEGEWKAYENDVKIHEKKMQQYYSEAAKNPSAVMPELRDAPPRTRFWTDDATLQGLAKTFPTNPRRKIALLFDELSGWFGSWDAFTNGKADIDRPAYLSFYESKSRIIDRAGGGTWFIDPFGGIVLGGIQPDVFAKIAARMPPDGMLQRLQIVISKPAKRVERRPADSAITAQWVKINENLAAMEPRGNPVRLSPAAAKYMDEQVRWIDHASQSGISPALAGALAKWEGLFGRLAITAHCIADAARGSRIPSPEVGIETMRQCWSWMRQFLWPHAVQFYNGTNVLPEDQTSLLSFANYILARNITEVKPGYLSGEWSHYRKFKTIQQRREFWDSVVNVGIARPSNDGFNKTGQIARTYYINPKFLDGRFAEQAELARQQADRYREIMHPAFVGAQKRQSAD